MKTKDYILIAEALRVQYNIVKRSEYGREVFTVEGQTVMAVAKEIADSLARDDSAFSKEHFLAVVRGESEEIS